MSRWQRYSIVFWLGMVAIVPAQTGLDKQEIFPYQDKHVHGSSVVECANGDLLACWFYGSGEREADDVVIQGSRLKKGSDRWEPVFLMADTPGFPDCNPVLFIDRNERLWLFWVAVQAHRWELSVLKYRVADDYQGTGAPQWSWQDVIMLKPGEEFAHTVKAQFSQLGEDTYWAEYAPLYQDMIIRAAQDPAKRQMGWMTRIHPLVLPGGRILLPLYSDGFCLGLCAISDDDGKTWRASLPMVGPGLNQPSLVRKDDGTLVAYMRDEGSPQKRILKSMSKDDGESWSFAEYTDLPNPGASVEAIRLESGEWVMVYNDADEGRHIQVAAISDDEGETWKWKRAIEQDKPGEKSFSYPSLIQARDGQLHLTYSYSDGKNKSIRHARFSAEWIKSVK